MRANLLIVALAIGIALVSAAAGVTHVPHSRDAIDRMVVRDGVEVAIWVQTPPKDINLRTRPW
jgi:hypothetical protein